MGKGGKRDPCEIRVVPFAPERRAVGDPRAQQDLDELGFCVFRDVAGPAQLRDLHSGFWDFLEAACPGVSRADKRTWGAGWPDSTDKGMVGASFVAHAPFMWKARELSAPVFEQLWGTRRLVSSLDRCNAFRPTAFDPSWTTRSGWYHVDQNGNTKPGLQCYQGMLDILGQGEDDGGIVVVAKSHQQFEALFDGRYGVGKGDFCILKGALLDRFVRRPLKICTQPGDFFVWDSRVIHCNTPALRPRVPDPNCEDKLERLVAYVSMCPIDKVPHHVLAKKRQAVLGNGEATSHWADEHMVAGRVVSTGRVFEPPELNLRQMQLAGVAPYEDDK